jgi:hypothetical protein
LLWGFFWGGGTHLFAANWDCSARADLRVRVGLAPGRSPGATGKACRVSGQTDRQPVMCSTNQAMERELRRWNDGAWLSHVFCRLQEHPSRESGSGEAAVPTPECASVSPSAFRQGIKSSVTGLSSLGEQLDAISSNVAQAFGAAPGAGGARGADGLPSVEAVFEGTASPSASAALPEEPEADEGATGSDGYRWGAAWRCPGAPAQAWRIREDPLWSFLLFLLFFCCFSIKKTPEKQ